ncbi:PH domain-containing protein [Luteimonas abyssi]|uniref:PH domain-containing protein n=1 Tax=Luteimonas abyssi TaxID=1247514 RepID=UPI000737CDDE|nr:PH domain-containing protein [Luteimonas abyssi]
MIELDDLGPAPPADAADDAGWQALPPRARWLFVLSGATGLAVPAAIALGLLGFWLGLEGAQRIGLAGVWLALVALAGWMGARRYRFTRWRIDADGFGLQRGRMWFTETRVPGTRVQHIDIRRGPLERRAGLSTLIVHTAGTRDSAVAVPCLDADDAERLRDRLAAWVEHDDDDT